MAKAKKVKDLDAKKRAEKVKGGGSQQDRKNVAKIQRDIAKISSDVKEALQGTGPTIQKTVKGPFE